MTRESAEKTAKTEDKSMKRDFDSIVLTVVDKPFFVGFWGSHPDEENDDCWNGDTYATLDEARAAFAAECSDKECAYIELDGPNVHEIRANPSYDRAHVERERRRADLEWQREQAMEAGMLHGIDAYNDEMGYS